MTKIQNVTCDVNTLTIMTAKKTSGVIVISCSKGERLQDILTD